MCEINHRETFPEYPKKIVKSYDEMIASFGIKLLLFGLLRSKFNMTKTSETLSINRNTIRKMLRNNNIKATSGDYIWILEENIKLYSLADKEYIEPIMIPIKRGIVDIDALERIAERLGVNLVDLFKEVRL